jgi:hypothetical protein
MAERACLERVGEVVLLDAHSAQLKFDGVTRLYEIVVIGILSSLHFLKTKYFPNIS